MIKLNEKNIGQVNLIIILLILIVFTISIGYLTLQSKKEIFTTLKKEVKEKFIIDKKEEIKFKVDHTNQLINEHSEQSIKMLKKTITNRVNNAYKIAYKIYLDHKDTKSNNQIVNIIKETLRPIRYEDGKGYIFITTLKGKEILFPVATQYENKNILDLKDAKGNFVIKEEISLVQDHQEGYIKDYWTKPYSKNKKMIYPKLTFVKAFKELNLYIGTGIYIDEFNVQVKEYVKNLITHLNKQNKKQYIMISEVLNIDGGNKFAKVIVHPTVNIGKIISDNKKDIYGKEYRKLYLKELKDKGETFLTYSFINPLTNKEMKKISYFKLNTQWNWIIGTGFYDDDIDKQILLWENILNNLFKKSIYQQILIFFISIVILFIAIYIINKFINDTILKYKEKVEEKQHELNKINNNLEEQILIEVEKNIKVNEQLYRSEKLAAMGEMVGNIAHQWRQPLSVISTGATGIVVQYEYGIMNEDEIIKTCNLINDNAQYLSQTIDDFRTFIKGDKKKSKFNLKNTVDSFLHLTEGTIKNHNIEVVLDLEENIIITGYENELKQCLINIFNNSKDALIENKIENKLVFITIKMIENKANIIIKDNAMGIPNNILNKIFEPYFTTKSESKGTGLGLYMSYNIIVNGMNGEIKVNNIDYEYNSISYKGAEFILTFNIV